MLHSLPHLSWVVVCEIVLNSPVVGLLSISDASSGQVWQYKALPPDLKAVSWTLRSVRTSLRKNPDMFVHSDAVSTACYEKQSCLCE